MREVTKRFEAVSRGRSVRVQEKANWVCNTDFEVSYDESTDTYSVKFTRNGWFEEAYRFIERWIRKHAEQLDGVYQPPPTEYADFTEVGSYWMFERSCGQCFEDFQTAIQRQIAILESERPNEGVFGAVMIESRVQALNGLASYIDQIADEVHAAVLSPKARDLVATMGLEIFGEGMTDDDLENR